MTTLPLAAYRQAIPSATYVIDDGDPGTAQTVSAMYNQIYQGSKNPEVNAMAIDIVNAANPRQFDFAGQRRAIFHWFGRNIRFVRDPVGVETVRTAPETLHRRGGDCDCQTVLMGALLSTIGNHVRITTVESQPGNPEFSHVFLEVLDGNRWVPVDSARPGARYARGPEYYRRRFAWPNPYDPTDDLGRFAMSGLNGYGMGQTAKEVNASYRPMQMQRLAGFRGLGRMGLGRLGRVRGLRGLRGLGQDDIDWSGIASAITAGTTGASNIIRAQSGQIPILTAQQLQQQYGAAVPLASSPIAPAGYINLFGTLIPTNTVLMGAAAFALLLIWEKR